MRTKQTERETKYIKVKTWDSMLSRWLLRFWFPVGQVQQHEEEEEWIKNEKSEVFYSVYRRTICEFNVGWLIFHSHSSLVLAIQHDLNHSIENWREEKKSTRNTFAWFKFRHVEKGQKNTFISNQNNECLSIVAIIITNIIQCSPFDRRFK